MGTLDAPSGHTTSGLPYNRFGRGREPLVVFQGLTIENAPMKAMEARYTGSMYAFLGERYTVFVVNRRRGLPPGCSIADLSDDYAAMVRQEFRGPVDVIGISTGGSICQQFAADHPDLVRKLVIHSSACTLGQAGKSAQMRAGECARKRDWRGCTRVMVGFMVPPSWYKRALVPIGSALMGLGAPEDPSDLVATIEAEDRFDFGDRLGDIVAPTLLVAGAEDPAYSPELFRETAEGIPDCRLVLYPEMGHPARGREFERDVLAFLGG